MRNIRVVGLKLAFGRPFWFFVTESITPAAGELSNSHFVPSMLSLRGSASTLAPPSVERSSSGPALRGGGARRRLWFFTALSVVSCIAGAGVFNSFTSDVSPQVRSASPGIRQAPSGENLHWARSTLTVHLDESLDRIGPSAREAIMRSFGSWTESDAKLPRLSFDAGKTRAVPMKDGKSTVSYGRITIKGHEKDLAITVTYADDASGEIVEADIILNSLYPLAVLSTSSGNGEPARATADAKAKGASDTGDDEPANENAHANHPKSPSFPEAVPGCANRYDLENLASHEVGHFFGLGEDPMDREATMFQTIDQCETHKRVLETSDVGALTTLYAASEPSLPEEQQASMTGCSVGSKAGRAPGAAAGVLLLLLGAAVRRRRPRATTAGAR